MITSKLLRLTQVKSATGLSKSTIYARIAEGTFPKQIPLGPRLLVWVDSDLQKWIAEQVSAARGRTPLFYDWLSMGLIFNQSKSPVAAFSVFLPFACT
jgi:prophage regulatory protein